MRPQSLKIKIFLCFFILSIILLFVVGILIILKSSKSKGSLTIEHVGKMEYNKFLKIINKGDVESIFYHHSSKPCEFGTAFEAMDILLKKKSYFGATLSYEINNYPTFEMVKKDYEKCGMPCKDTKLSEQIEGCYIID